MLMLVVSVKCSYVIYFVVDSCSYAIDCDYVFHDNYISCSFQSGQKVLTQRAVVADKFSVLFGWPPHVTCVSLAWHHTRTRDIRCHKLLLLKWLFEKSFVGETLMWLWLDWQNEKTRAEKKKTPNSLTWTVLPETIYARPLIILGWKRKCFE